MNGRRSKGLARRPRVFGPGVGERVAAPPLTVASLPPPPVPGLGPPGSVGSSGSPGGGGGGSVGGGDDSLEPDEEPPATSVAQSVIQSPLFPDSLTIGCHSSSSP